MSIGTWTNLGHFRLLFNSIWISEKKILLQNLFFLSLFLYSSSLFYYLYTVSIYLYTVYTVYISVFVYLKV